MDTDKVKRILESLNSFQHRKSSTLKELLSLISTLNFACKVIPPGRPFLQRMVALTRNVKQPYYHIKLNSGFFKDLNMWQQFIVTWNWAAFSCHLLGSTQSPLELYTDGSGALGFGGIFQLNQMVFWQLVAHHKLGEPGLSIALQELSHWLSHAICGVSIFQTSESFFTVTTSLWFSLSILNGHTYQESWI